MARLHPKVRESFYAIVRDVKAHGGHLIVSDMFRPWQVQMDLRARKPRLAKKPGQSYHEAGLAWDFDISQLGISLAEFHVIVKRNGWMPITPPDPHKAECWHIQHPYESLGYHSLQEAIKDVGNWAA
jgi:hypothetical protein